MVLYFWNKIKDSYTKYKIDKKYSQLFIIVLYALLLVIEVFLAVIWVILRELFHALQEWDRKQRIESQIRHARERELRTIRQNNEAAGEGYQDGITRSKFQTKLEIEDNRRRKAEQKAFVGNIDRAIKNGFTPPKYMRSKKFKPPWGF